MSKQDQAIPFTKILPFFVPSLFLALNYVGYYCMNKNPFLHVWVAYSCLPVLDWAFPLDKKNLTSEEEKAFEKDKRFLIPLYTYWILDFMTYVWALNIVSSGEVQGVFYFLCFTFGQSQLGGANAVVGHELFHRRETIHKITGTLTYFKMLYSHFFMEHTRGHHIHVATPECSASADKGEKLFAYYFRSISGGYKSAWNQEKKRLKGNAFSL